MKPDKDRHVLEKMVGYAKDSWKYNESTELADFLSDERTIVFTVFSLSQLGELVGRLSESCMEGSPHIPWAKIKSLRNRIVHEYEGITYKTVWQIVQNDIPKLIENLTELLESKLESNVAKRPTEAQNMQIEVTKNPSAELLDKLGCSSWPIWEKEPSTFPWHYSEKETCLILAGRVTVTPTGAPNGGEPVTFGKGDLVVLPQGMSCTWLVQEAVRKHYRFGE